MRVESGIRCVGIAAVTVCLFSLLGCASPGPGPGTPTPSPTATASAAPTPSTEPTTTSTPIAIPTDCHDVVSSQVYEATFADMPLNDPSVIGDEEAGAVHPSEPPAGATAAQVLDSKTQLRCIWRDPGADITYLEARVATADTGVTDAVFAGLPAEGFTCVEANGGQQCQRVTPNETYPVDEIYTHFRRDGVYVYLGSANVPAGDLMADVVAALWG